MLHRLTDCETHSDLARRGGGRDKPQANHARSGAIVNAMIDPGPDLALATTAAPSETKLKSRPQTLICHRRIQLTPTSYWMGDRLGNTATAEPVDGGWVIVRHLIADGLDIQKAKDPLMSQHAQHFHNACSSWVRR
jgi:hypothetical protein